MFNPYNKVHGFRVNAVAELSGLSPHVIRKWEQRYQILNPIRGPNGYRIYFEDDLQLLLYIKSQLDAGKSIGQLAEMGQKVLRRAMTQGPIHIIGVPQNLANQAEAIVQAARHLDRSMTEGNIHKLIVRLGLEKALEKILFPVLRTVGDLWHRGEVSITGEQMITQSVRRHLVETLHKRDSANRPTSIIACAPDDFHEIGAIVSAIFLQKVGWQAIYLGADSEIEVIRLACKRRKASLAIIATVIERSRKEFGVLAKKIADRLLGICPVVIGGKGAAGFREILESHGIQYLPNINDIKGFVPP